jgi:hypothetical protein
MKPERTVNCRRTRKVCNVYFGLCDGCGHPAANCEVKPKKLAAFRVSICPACHSNCHREIEPGRYSCQKCNAIFEPIEQTFIDDRPLENAMRKEAQTNGRRHGAVQ